MIDNYVNIMIYCTQKMGELTMRELSAQDKLEVLQSDEEFQKAFPDAFYAFPMKTPDKRQITPGERARREAGRKTYDIQRLWSRHKEIINLDSLGYKSREIADMLGINEKTVSNTLNSTLGIEAKEAVRGIRDQEYELMRDKVMELTWMALGVYEETFGDVDHVNVTPKEQREAARDVVLEMSGLRAPTKIQSQSVATVLTAEELNEFKQRGFEASKNAGKLIEIEGE